MGWGDLFKFLGPAMEAATTAAEAYAAVKMASSPDSPGGSAITPEEVKVLADNLEDNLGRLVTEIIQVVGLPTTSVEVDITINP